MMMQGMLTKESTHAVNAPPQNLPLSSALQSEIDSLLANNNSDKAAIRLFEELLKLQPQEIRKYSVEKLAQINSKKAIERLGAALYDPDQEISFRAIELLEELHTPEAEEYLIKVLEDKPTFGGDFFYQRIVQTLGGFDSEKAVDALIGVLKNPCHDGYLAETAVFSLERIGSEKAIQALTDVILSLSISSNGMTSFDAASALRRLAAKNEKAMDGLFKRWNSPNRLLRFVDSTSMDFLHKPDSLIKPLCQRLKDKSRNDRKTAAEILGCVGTENEISLLESVWQDWEGDKEVGRAAHRAAEQIALSEIKAKAERVRALEETRAFITHEVRSAITPVSVYAEMMGEELAKPEPDKAKLEKFAQRILKQTHTANRVLNKYVDYSRPLHPIFEPMNMGLLLKQTLEEFAAICHKQKIKVCQKLSEEIIGLADKQMLSQVFRNLLNNAIEAMPQGGQLTVSAKSDGKRISITISDTGIGFKEEHLARVFELGFTTKLNQRGAGVGLALSRRLIEEAHNGSISLVNNPTGKGVLVTISLPLKQREAADVQ